MSDRAQQVLQGRYLYCVVGGTWTTTLGDIGIDRKSVYAIAYRDVSAIVHKCSLTPYQSKDPEQVRQWLTAHHRVVKICHMKTGTAVPIAFDTIIKGGDDAVRMWLNGDYGRLKEKIRRLRGKAEFGVQIFWNPTVTSHELMNENDRLKELRIRQEKSSEGMAYVLAKQIERELGQELERKGEQYVRHFYSKIARTVDDIRLDRPKKSEGQLMLMNVSVLVASEKEKFLRGALGKIKETNGIRVRLAGPWPPYSFV